VKIQETVYEILTKQYELAKVQEAKEIPTVTVLDPPDVPERKSFPSRILIILLGVCLTLIGSITWLVGNEAWRRTDDSQPTKAFIREVLGTLSRRNTLSWK
jgi:uncharacterized protein involved in exopolysaccharide biosynthesis